MVYSVVLLFMHYISVISNCVSAFRTCVGRVVEGEVDMSDVSI